MTTTNYNPIGVAQLFFKLQSNRRSQLQTTRHFYKHLVGVIQLFFKFQWPTKHICDNPFIFTVSKSHGLEYKPRRPWRWMGRIRLGPCGLLPTLLCLQLKPNTRDCWRVEDLVVKGTSLVVSPLRGLGFDQDGYGWYNKSILMSDDKRGLGLGRIWLRPWGFLMSYER